MKHSALLWVCAGLVLMGAGLLLLALKLTGPLHMSVHGYIALALGCALTALSAAGLMGLAFYSDRKGFDDINREP